MSKIQKEKEAMFDYIIIGAGPGGVGLAHLLNHKKYRVAIVEQDKWGGTCPNYGCDPTKVMMAVIEAKKRVDVLQGQGISGNLKIDWAGLRERKTNLTDPYEKGIFEGLNHAGITTIYGAAEFTEAGTIRVGEIEYEAENYIIATGTRPRQLEISGHEFLLTSNDFLNLDELPHRIIFLGAGSVSLELAQIARAIGVEVTVVTSGKLGIAHFDEEMGNVFLEQLKRDGIKFRDNFVIQQVEKVADGFVMTDEKGTQLKSDLIVAGVGRVANVDKLNLEAVGVKADAKGIKVDAFLKTSHPNIYGLGDVISKNLGHLTPVSDFESRYLGEFLGEKIWEEIHYPVIPSVIFGAIKLAEVGDLNGEGLKVKSLNLENWYTYKRINDPVAKIKVAMNSQGEIVGASIVSSVADELVNLLTVLIQQKMTLSQVNALITAYPTVGSDLAYFY